MRGGGDAHANGVRFKKSAYAGPLRLRCVFRRMDTVGKSHARSFSRIRLLIFPYIGGLDFVRKEMKLQKFLLRRLADYHSALIALQETLKYVDQIQRRMRKPVAGWHKRQNTCVWNQCRRCGKSGVHVNAGASAPWAKSQRRCHAPPACIPYPSWLIRK